MPAYKALTVHQPWADLIAHGLKEYETRDWKTDYRGLLMIHAGKQWGDEQMAYVKRFMQQFPATNAVFAGEVALGCIVAAVTLIDCIPVEQIRDTLSATERAFGNYDDGRYAWKMQLIRAAVKPIPAAGKQGIWTWHYERQSA